MTTDYLTNIYNLMLKAYGPRNWWPAETPFEVIIGAILTQNVAWTNVEKAIAALKTRGLLNLEGLLQIQIEELAELIRPSGYYNMKAKKLKAFCHFMYDYYDGSLTNMCDTPLYKLRGQLLGVYGIGKETADSILLYAANKPIFVVDTYTKRIFTRLGLLHAQDDYDEIQDFFMKHLPVNVQLFNEYHALIVALGSTCCSNKNTKCQICPLLGICIEGNNFTHLSS